ncbi:MAG: hypothetical protein LBP92_02360 [Deltaproteobacteria bacterium]|jgi:hypothetical protein|nr:hypothetical protein [Deltaproteobacteria bacterium]
MDQDEFWRLIGHWPGWHGVVIEGKVRIARSMATALAEATDTDLSLWWDEDPGAAVDTEGRRKALVGLISKGPPLRLRRKNSCPSCGGQDGR